MFRLLRLFRTSIGSKLVVTITGLLLIAFLLGHMLGNMKVFQGQQSLNEYAAWLQGHPFLWVFRISMVLIFGFHVSTAIRVAWQNWRARPQRYVRQATVEVGLAARFMLASGVVVFGFLVFHLVHLTFGGVGPAPDPLHDLVGRPDVYGRVIAGFREPWIAGVYLLGLVLMGFHLNHAIASLFQTLGFNHETYQALLRFIAPALTVVLVIGFASVPALVALGVVGTGAGGAP